jgi:hypothetical protein
MKLKEILQRVDDEFDEQFFYLEGGGDYDGIINKETVRAFIHAEIKQAILDVLPEEKRCSLGSSKLRGDVEVNSWNECRQEILNNLEE